MYPRPIVKSDSMRSMASSEELIREEWLRELVRTMSGEGRVEA